MCCLVQAIVEVKDLCQSGRYSPSEVVRGSHIRLWTKSEHVGTSLFCSMRMVIILFFCAETDPGGHSPSITI